MNSHRSICSNLSEDIMRQVAEYAKDWAQIHGICTRLNDQADRSDLARIQAFTLTPSYIPVKVYNEACKIQKYFGLLYHRIPHDFHFMQTNLKKVMDVDDFTKNLFEIYEDVYQKESAIPAQPVTLTIQRADYMLHCPDEDSAVIENHCDTRNRFDCVLKQVEVNTMASGAAGISCQVARLHDQIFKRFPDLKPRLPGRLAENRALDNVTCGMFQAWKQYAHPDALVLFVIEGLDLNAMDQRLTEYRLAELSDCAIKVVRYTLKQIAENFYVDEQCGRKLKKIGNGQEVALVYFRSAYVPSQYPTEVEWRARRMIERSAAIKCPWIGAQLAGCKKIQQILTNRQTVLEFMANDEEAVDRMIATFAKIYSLDSDDPNVESIVKKALREEDRYVLKPQREGGGNNLFGSAVAKKLKAASPQELESYVLMERLKPLMHENVLVRANEPLKLVQADSELGTFGYLLGTCNEIPDQAQYGHLFRTKPAKDNEGGTIKGTAGHDTPFLIC